MFDFYREALLNTLFKGKIFLQSFCNASIPPYIFLLQKGFFFMERKALVKYVLSPFMSVVSRQVVENCSLILSIKFSPQI